MPADFCWQNNLPVIHQLMPCGTSTQHILKSSHLASPPSVLLLCVYLFIWARYGRELWEINGKGFHRLLGLPLCSHQCQSVEGNSKHWSQPSLILSSSATGLLREGAWLLYASCLMWVPLKLYLMGIHLLKYNHVIHNRCGERSLAWVVAEIW